MNEEEKTADLAQRVADLGVELEKRGALLENSLRRLDELRAQLAELGAQRDSHKAAFAEWMPLAGYIRELVRDGTAPIHSLGHHCADVAIETIKRLICQRGELRARLAELERQEPVAWIEHDHSGTGQKRLHFVRRRECLRDEVINPVWTPLYARPVPAIPEGWKLVKVKAAEFDSLMYWLERCESKGHMEQCSDLIEPWHAFEYADVAAPGHKA